MILLPARLATPSAYRRLSPRHRSILRCFEHVASHLGDRPAKRGQYYFFNLGINHVFWGVDAPMEIDDLCRSYGCPLASLVQGFPLA